MITCQLFLPCLYKRLATFSIASSSDLALLCLTDILMIIHSSRSDWSGVWRRERKKAEFEALTLSLSFFRQLLPSLFVREIEYKTMKAFEDRVSESIHHYPHLYDFL